MDAATPIQGETLERIVAGLAPEAFYQSPGGRRFLITAALIAGLPRGARVLDVQCGIAPATVDLAEAFGCRVIAFDDYAPYLAFGKQQATARGVGKLVGFRTLDGAAAAAAFEAGSFDVVLGLGGGLSDTLPGGLIGGLAAAARWLVPGGLLICGDLVSPGPPSDLMRILFGEMLHGEEDYLTAVAAAGFDPIFAARATTADWDQMRASIARLRERALDLGPTDERQRLRLTDAARNHPEVAYLNVVARRRADSR